MFGKKKKVEIEPISVMKCNKRFVAAYSEHPFTESSKEFPDYVFSSENGLYWCVRIGMIEIPWGFGEKGVGFSANGSVWLKRKNLSASLTFDGSGFKFIKVGNIFYLYELELGSDGFYGFSADMRDRLLPEIRKSAIEAGQKEVFKEKLKTFCERDAVKKILGSSLEIVSISIN